MRNEKFKEFLSNNTDSNITFAITDKNRILGYTNIHKKEWIGHIQSIYVDPYHHGKGLGSKLMNKALDWLSDCKEVHVELTQYNHKAIDFYKKFGFQQNPEYLEYLDVEGVQMPIIEMIRS